MIGSVASVPRRLDLVILGAAMSLALLGILFVASTTGEGGASSTFLVGSATEGAASVKVQAKTKASTKAAGKLRLRMVFAPL